MQLKTALVESKANEIVHTSFLLGMNVLYMSVCARACVCVRLLVEQSFKPDFGVSVFVNTVMIFTNLIQAQASSAHTTQSRCALHFVSTHGCMGHPLLAFICTRSVSQTSCGMSVPAEHCGSTTLLQQICLEAETCGRHCSNTHRTQWLCVYVYIDICICK